MEKNMIHYAFAAICLVHGLIHLLGFAKAFQLGKISQLTNEIPKPVGLLWLLATLLLLIAFVLFVFRDSNWAWVCITGIALSQSLILLSWQDAKFGTLANILLLLVALPGWGSIRFGKQVKNEQLQLLAGIKLPDQRPVTRLDLQPLPAPVQQWLRHSGVVGKPPIHSIRLRQKGKMKLKPGSKWMDFTAIQYFNTQQPAFVWNTRVNMMPFMYFEGRDKYEHGNGSMLIKLLSLVNIVNEQNNPQVNSGTALRYLGEICWFPSAALSSYITWQQVDSLQARATLQVGDEKVNGLFTFRENGELASFEAERYFGGGSDAKKERWLITNNSYKAFEGILIPNQSTVTWKLKEGDFTWLQVEITALEVNRKGLIKALR